ncbi:MAG: 3-isopropylmalate/(R)-2-methylmalate dehydratase small subunit [Actinomycetota bacterium]|jgi:3-isopropylmalate/(R)-2-methylmalate dehydratase small subunit|nr:3-isopropylmalate/(R)-2-methylmalate dehydratase small subunit [Actinomycetota bacterium]
MDAFTVHTGRAVPLRRSDVDTDQIISSDWLKRVERTGFGAGLFIEWREEPAFVLNQPQYADATVLLAGENFGTGSSREHAVWALQDHGFRAVISSQFADIFRSNAFKGGLLPVELPADVVEDLMSLVETDPSIDVTIDLTAREVRAGDLRASFEIDDFTRWRLLEGLDDIGLTLRHAEEISSFEKSRPSFLPVMQ